MFLRCLIHSQTSTLNRPVPAYLQTLLSISKKSELRKFVKQIVISRQDFVMLVWNPAAVGYYHNIKSREFRPDDPNLKSPWVFNEPKMKK
jgi:hypothetical protein